MARSPFGRGRPGEMDPEMEGKMEGSHEGGLSAFIDQGSEFEGKLSFKDTVRIDGQFRGEIQSENTLIVGETGEIDAKIVSKVVVVSGAVVGDIVANRQLVLHSTARLQGNVETSSLVIEEGAVLNGQISMSRPETRTTLKAVDGGPPASAAS